MAKKIKKAHPRKTARTTTTKSHRAKTPTKKSAKKAASKPEGAIAIVVKLAKKVLEPSDPVSMEKLMEFLSEFLAVEHGGMHLYRAAADNSRDPELRETYLEYLRQTERHAELLIYAITRLGGDPSFVSPGAEVQTQRANSMLELDVPPALRELQDAESLLLAETKDHADWEFLGSIASKIPDENARSVIQEIVDEVEDQEDEHLKFAQKAVERLANLQIRGTRRNAA